MEKPPSVSLGSFSLWVLSLAEGFVLALQEYLFGQVQIRPFPRGCLDESKVTEVIESFPDDLNSMHPSMETKLFGNIASARLRLSCSWLVGKPRCALRSPFSVEACWEVWAFCALFRRRTDIFWQRLINLIWTLFDLNCYKWNYKWKRPENSIP